MAVMRVAVDVPQPALAVRIGNEGVRHQALDAVPFAANDLVWLVAAVQEIDQDLAAGPDATVGADLVAIAERLPELRRL